MVWITLTITLFVIAICYLLLEKQPKTSVIESKLALLEAAQKIEERFLNGDLEGFIKKNQVMCPDIIQANEFVHKRYWRCNPYYLECLLRNEIESLPLNSFSDTAFAITAVPTKSRLGAFRYVDFTEKENLSLPHYSFTLALENEKEIMESFTLEGTCHENFLPIRKYMTYVKNSFLSWDNTDLNIFVDSFLVSKGDMQLYQWLHPDRKILEKAIPVKDYGQYATNISFEHMKGFCQSRGKHLLSHRVFEAASYFPPRLEIKMPIKWTPGPYPWSYQVKFEKNFLPKMKDSCQAVFSSDCEREKFISFETDRFSWLPIYDVLGGPFEYLRNEILPRKNVKLSSYHFPSSSSSHKIWARGEWDEKTRVNTLIHTDAQKELGRSNLEDKNETDKLEVGFRCMRYY